MSNLTQTKWKMPHWMEKYIPMITKSKLNNNKGESMSEKIEILVNHDYVEETRIFKTRICAKIELLQQLHDKHLI